MSYPNEKQHRQGWLTSLFNCWSPFDTCLAGCCTPCVLYGKARHRIANNGNMEDYSCCNGSCMLFYISSHFGMCCVPLTIQSGDIRHKYNLEGTCCAAFMKATCCSCCTVIQHDKEIEHREELLKHSRQQPYVAQLNMDYPTAPSVV